MRLIDGRYECVLCGEVLDIPPTARPSVVLEASGGARNIRVLSLNGREIHRCDSGRNDVDAVAPPRDDAD